MPPKSHLCRNSVCWRRPSGGLATGWPLGSLRLFTPPLFLKCVFCPRFPQQELFSGCSLDRARCCQTLDGICD